MTFTDYRLEFFGQIENKGMSWTVRSKDRQELPRHEVHRDGSRAAARSSRWCTTT